MTNAARTAPRFSLGAHVWVKRRGRWWPAMVRRAASTAYRVRYDDWGVHSEEDVASSRVAPGSERPPGLRGTIAMEVTFAVCALLLLAALVLGLAIVRDGL